MYWGEPYFKNKLGFVDPLIGTPRPIVIVEDNVDDQFLLRREIEFLFGDAPVIVFRNGTGLLRYLYRYRSEGDEKKPWLILLDLNMPEMNGINTLKALKKEPALADIAIVIISGVLDDEEIHACSQHGATAFLPKPCTRKKLMDLMHHNVEQ